MSTTTSRRRIGFIAWLIAFHVLLAYGLTEWLFISLAIMFGVLYYRISTFGAATVSLALLVITIVYGLALKITGFEDNIYFRPDEKYARFDHTNNHHLYQSNVHIEMDMPHGELRPLTTEDIVEPRHVVFHTDADGFRNERDYHGQRYVLVGDSFVAGNSNSQEDLLATQLADNYSLDTYSLAFAGNVADYAAYVGGFVKRHGENARVLLFLFEGNDFEESRGRNTSALARYGRQYYEMFSGLNTYRVTMSLYKRMTRGRAIRVGSGIEVAELGSKKVAFYKQYIDVTRRAQRSEPEGFGRAIESMRPYLEHVYFIPTKYRVYYQHLKPGATLPNAQWNYLKAICEKYTLRCTDLTVPLTKESDRLLKKGEYTWWRDDTHWNRHGIAVAARAVAIDIGASTGKEIQR
jgi:hypothetical protein